MSSGFQQPGGDSGSSGGSTGGPVQGGNDPNGDLGDCSDLQSPCCQKATLLLLQIDGLYKRVLFCLSSAQKLKTDIHNHIANATSLATLECLLEVSDKLDAVAAQLNQLKLDIGAVMQAMYNLILKGDCKAALDAGGRLNTNSLEPLCDQIAALVLQVDFCLRYEGTPDLPPTGGTICDQALRRYAIMQHEMMDLNHVVIEINSLYGNAEHLYNQAIEPAKSCIEPLLFLIRDKYFLAGKLHAQAHALSREAFQLKFKLRTGDDPEICQRIIDICIEISNLYYIIHEIRQQVVELYNLIVDCFELRV